jgi:type I restriction enzyme, R subunit
VRDAILTHRLSDAILRLNPTVPEVIREEALGALTKDRVLMDPVRANREVYGLFRNGYQAEWQGETGDREYATVQFVFAHKCDV